MGILKGRFLGGCMEQRSKIINYFKNIFKRKKFENLIFHFKEFFYFYFWNNLRRIGQKLNKFHQNLIDIFTNYFDTLC